jgi:pyruvate/2-oxoglutarate dehydrogenase complex dihydrolipoamide acyltransferase (E2) component
MREPIIVPELGFADIVVSVWYVRPGEEVFKGDRVVELLLGSTTFEVTASASGTLIEQCAHPQERVTPGQVVGFLQAPG